MNKDITRRRGDTFPHRIVVTDSRTGEPVDITGFSFKLTVDPAEFPADASANLFQVAGVISDPTGGIVEFSPSAADVNHVGDYYYDIEMVDTASKKRTIAHGAFKLVQDITK